MGCGTSAPKVLATPSTTTGSNSNDAINQAKKSNTSLKEQDEACIKGSHKEAVPDENSSDNSSRGLIGDNPVGKGELVLGKVDSVKVETTASVAKPPKDFSKSHQTTTGIATEDGEPDQPKVGPSEDSSARINRKTLHDTKSKTSSGSVSASISCSDVPARDMDGSEPAKSDAFNVETTNVLPVQQENGETATTLDRKSELELVLEKKDSLMNANSTKNMQSENAYATDEAIIEGTFTKSRPKVKTWEDPGIDNKDNWNCMNESNTVLVLQPSGSEFPLLMESSSRAVSTRCNGTSGPDRRQGNEESGPKCNNSYTISSVQLLEFAHKLCQEILEVATEKTEDKMQDKDAGKCLMCDFKSEAGLLTDHSKSSVSLREDSGIVETRMRQEPSVHENVHLRSEHEVILHGTEKNICCTTDSGDFRKEQQISVVELVDAFAKAEDNLRQSVKSENFEGVVDEILNENEQEYLTQNIDKATCSKSASKGILKDDEGDYQTQCIGKVTLEQDFRSNLEWDDTPINSQEQRKIVDLNAKERQESETLDSLQENVISLEEQEEYSTVKQDIKLDHHTDGDVEVKLKPQINPVKNATEDLKCDLETLYSDSIDLTRKTSVSARLLGEVINSPVNDGQPQTSLTADDCLLNANVNDSSLHDNGHQEIHPRVSVDCLRRTLNVDCHEHDIGQGETQTYTTVCDSLSKLNLSETNSSGNVGGVVDTSPCSIAAEGSSEGHLSRGNGSAHDCRPVDNGSTRQKIDEKDRSEQEIGHVEITTVDVCCAVSGGESNNGDVEEDTPSCTSCVPPSDTQGLILVPTQELSDHPPADPGNNEEAHSTANAKENENDTQDVYKASQQEIVPIRDEKAEVRLATVLRFACQRLPPEHILEFALPGITAVQLRHAVCGLPLSKLLTRLTSLQELDLSGNQMGPQAFRVVCLSMRRNSTLKSLNLANNGGDTDSSGCLGLMLSENSTLERLDVSGNSLGKDYFSRCVGPALCKNRTLKSLKCSSCGANDVTAVMESLSDDNGNTALTELDISHNQLQEKTGEQIADVIKKACCPLRVLNVQGTGLKAHGMELLQGGLTSNTSLGKLIASGNEVPSLGFLMEFIFCSTSHPSLVELHLESTKSLDTTEEWNEDPECVSPNTVSKMKVLNLSGCSLTDSAVEYLASRLEGHLVNLVELNLSCNELLTATSLSSFMKMIAIPGIADCLHLQALDFALNNAEDIPSLLSKQENLRTLNSLSLRKCKISPVHIGELCEFVLENAEGGGEPCKSLILDGVKISGTDALPNMLHLTELCVPTRPCVLSALSFSGCSLNDKDVRSLMVAVGKGLGLVELKLSVNRLTDSSVSTLVDSISGECSLRILNLANNKIRNSGAEQLANCLHDKFSNLQRLSLANNCIGADGLESLVSKLGPKCVLTALELKSQQQSVDEEDLDRILQHLVECFGNEGFSYANVLKLPSGFSLNLTRLGGESGNLGRKIDSLAIQTDYSQKHRRTLGFDDAFHLSAVLFSSASEHPVIGQEDWNRIIGAEKDAPAWLQVATHRRRAVYITNLPLTVTSEKLHGQLDSEAECNVKEVYLAKDDILRKPNGLAWVLFDDEASVTKALDYYNSAQAVMYGRPFVISGISVEVRNDTADDSEAQLKARREIQERETQRLAEQAANQTLIQSSYQESKARHEYAAQHPAYADGWIW